MRWSDVVILWACAVAATTYGSGWAQELASGADLAAVFSRQVDRRLDVPPQERAEYAQRLDTALTSAGLSDLVSQYVVMVDRSPHVQAVFIYWRSEQARWEFIGAAPVSTGKPGTYDHFLTPLGVFKHSIDNMDFRAEGTLNDNGIRGYGRKGMRVFDFGWVSSERGWGTHGASSMRLQMHATDPDVLEKQLGQTGSKGCIRIPAALDVFIDHYGLLDADYERAVADGRHLWVLPPDREPTAWPGQYLVIVESNRIARPAWAPQRSAAQMPRKSTASHGGSTCGEPRAG